MKKHVSKSASQTANIAADFGRTLKPGRVIGLIGDLGAGKTTFVQGLARGLGIDPDYYVNSPTFTLINEYRGQGSDLIHVDLYRIEKPLEGETLGLDEYLASGAIVAVEWIERMPALEKLMTHKVEIREIAPNSREISIISLP
ncbi:MAG TPA: tRNA (adenosine(37)-N6)-threonylcarbamoyltransferase complex ATPase subunit type 1 TsaE [bacterium]|nr:tRNA (adenosine(37)-N6)-threonylcarbamoyltransferase complex ATPase subunit type 1 TsaE [bacterium]